MGLAPGACYEWEMRARSVVAIVLAVAVGTGCTTTQVFEGSITVPKAARACSDACKDLPLPKSDWRAHPATTGPDRDHCLVSCPGATIGRNRCPPVQEDACFEMTHSDTSLTNLGVFAVWSVVGVALGILFLRALPVQRPS